MPAEKRDGVRRDGRIPRGLAVRLFAYLVAGHIFSAFLYLLFALGAE